MKKFTVNLLVFLSPLFLILGLPVYILWSSGEAFLDLRKAVFNSGLVGYAYNSSNYERIKWFRIKEDDKLNIITLGSFRLFFDDGVGGKKKCLCHRWSFREKIEFT